MFEIRIFLITQVPQRSSWKWNQKKHDWLCRFNHENKQWTNEIHSEVLYLCIQKSSLPGF